MSDPLAHQPFAWQPGRLGRCRSPTTAGPSRCCAGRPPTGRSSAPRPRRPGRDPAGPGPADRQLQEGQRADGQDAGPSVGQHRRAAQVLEDPEPLRGQLLGAEVALAEAPAGARRGRRSAEHGAAWARRRTRRPRGHASLRTSSRLRHRMPSRSAATIAQRSSATGAASAAPTTRKARTRADARAPPCRWPSGRWAPRRPAGRAVCRSGRAGSAGTAPTRPSSGPGGVPPTPSLPVDERRARTARYRHLSTPIGRARGGST